MENEPMKPHLVNIVEELSGSCVSALLQTECYKKKGVSITETNDKFKEP